jgi:hypothetical protein
MAFICEVCNYTTNRKSNLTQHKNRKKPCYPSKSEKSVLCKQCNDTNIKKTPIEINSQNETQRLEAERLEIISLTAELEEVRRGIRVKVNDTTTTTNVDGKKETFTNTYVTNLSDYIKIKPEFRDELLGYIDIAEKARADARITN